jgi:hypothetical protein
MVGVSEINNSKSSIVEMLIIKYILVTFLASLFTFISITSFKLLTKEGTIYR